MGSVSVFTHAYLPRVTWCQDGYIWLNMINKPTDIKNKLTGKDATQSKMFEMSSNVTIRRWYIIQHRALQSRYKLNSTEIWISYSTIWALESVMFFRFSNKLEIIIINPPWLDNARVVKKSAPWANVHARATLSEVGCLIFVNHSTAKTFRSKKINTKPNMTWRQKRIEKNMSRKNAQKVFIMSDMLHCAQENYTQSAFPCYWLCSARNQALPICWRGRIPKTVKVCVLFPSLHTGGDCNVDRGSVQKGRAHFKQVHDAEKMFRDK